MSQPGQISLVPGAKYSLILISNPRVNERWDFELLASYVREIAPDIQAAPKKHAFSLPDVGHWTVLTLDLAD